MNSPLLNNTLAAARTAGEIIREHWRQPHDIHYKGRIDLVTQTDAAIEAHLHERLHDLLPEMGFMGEESARSLLPDGDCWIVDPLDGTTNFVHGIPFVAVSIALWQGGMPRLGVVAMPMLNEYFYAEKGHGAYCNGQAIQVSQIARCERALIATGSPMTLLRKKTASWNGSELPCPNARVCAAAARPPQIWLT